MKFFKSKKMFYLLFSLNLIINLTILLSFPVYGAYPKLVSKIVSAFEKIETYIVAIATPAAGVAIGSRIFNAKI